MIEKYKCRACGDYCNTEYWSPMPGTIPAYNVSSCCKSEIMKEKVEEKTLRDEFAMAALTGMIIISKDVLISYEEIAQAAYSYADAMLKAREGKDE